MSLCVIDTSVLIAIAFAEPNADALTQRIASYAERSIGAPSLLEAGMVFAGRKKKMHRDPIDQLVAAFDTQTLKFTAEMEARAWNAWLRYGKGRHPASLNFGDA